MQEEYQSFFPTPVSSIINNRRFVNEKKVTDHYAIIPTEQVPTVSKLSGDEKRIYDLIARRLIAAHYQVAIFDYTTVTTLVDERAVFTTKGKQKLQDGWRKVLYDEENGKKDEDVLLPDLKINDQGHVEEIRIKEGKTQAPNRYTEGQLITLMKTAGKHLDNAELEKILSQTEGLGTEATRAGIITLLKQRNYIEVQKNKVYATRKAQILIEAIGGKILASPEMTAKWEQRLREIGKGNASSQTFMAQTQKLSQKIVQDAMGQAVSWEFNHIEFEASGPKKQRSGAVIGKCMLCNGDVIDKGKVYGCSNYQKTKCSLMLPKKIMGKAISPTNAKKLLTDGKTGLIKGFKKDDKVFDAMIQWDKNQQKVSFVFPENKTLMK